MGDNIAKRTYGHLSMVEASKLGLKVRSDSGGGKKVLNGSTLAVDGDLRGRSLMASKFDGRDADSVNHLDGGRDTLIITSADPSLVNDNFRVKFGHVAIEDDKDLESLSSSWCLEVTNSLSPGGISDRLEIVNDGDVDCPNLPNRDCLFVQPLPSSPECVSSDINQKGSNG